jgi:hypothetical protein
MVTSTSECTMCCQENGAEHGFTLIGLLAVIAFIAVLPLLSLLPAEPARGTESLLGGLPPVVAEVNGEPVEREAMAHWMERERHAVIRHFHRAHGVTLEAASWQVAHRHGGESPLAMLWQRTIGTAVETKILLQLSEANGLIEGTTAESVARLHRLHQEVRTADRTGDAVIYGPRVKSHVAFRDHLFAMLKLELEARLGQGRLRFPVWVSEPASLSAAPSIDELFLRLRAQSTIKLISP